MISRRTSEQWGGLAALLVAGSQMASAAGYYLPNQDALATAKGNAWVATADSAAAVFYNPAGLTQLEAPELVGGVYAIRLDTSLSHPTGDYSNRTELQGVPYLYFAKPLTDRLAAGISLNTPFGLGGEWDQASPFPTVITEARLAHTALTGALGYAITDTLSVGVSVSGNYTDLMLEQGVGLAPNDFLRFEGDGYSVSGGISLRWQPSDRHAFGLVYQSGSTPDLSGKTKSTYAGLNGAADLEFFTPARAALGYSYRPAPGWNIEANLEWLDWDSLNTLALVGTGPGVVPIPFQWESMFIYEIGASYEFGDGYQVAIGYDYNSNAMPDRFYNPVVADADIHYLNLGFGRETDCWSWFVTYQVGYANRTVTGALPTLAGQTSNGKYSSRHNALMLSLSREF